MDTEKILSLVRDMEWAFESMSNLAWDNAPDCDDEYTEDFRCNANAYEEQFRGSAKELKKLLGN